MVYLHDVYQPKLWSKPVSKVYDSNRISGEFYYKVRYLVYYKVRCLVY